MANTSPISGSAPSLQPGERVSGPLPEAPNLPSTATIPAVQQASTSTQRQQRAGNLLARLGSVLTLIGFFLPTYLALPLLDTFFYSGYTYVGSLYLTPENARITGMQILFLQTSFGGFFSNTGFTLLALQGVILAAVMNTLSLASTRQRKFSFRSGVIGFVALLFLACLGMYTLLYFAAITLPVLISLSFTAKRSDHVRAWLRIGWPVIGIGALIGSTTHFYSTMAGILPQVTGPTAYSYDYFASLGSGAWLSLAGLLTALLGGLFAFHASKQQATPTP
jgi:hypothetical protein